jgi:FixJ family two-component response regulator
MSISASKKSERILVLTDRESPAFYHTFFKNSRKVEIHTFQESSNFEGKCSVDIIIIDCSTDIEAGLKILKRNKTVCPNVPNIFITDLNYKGLVLQVYKSGARDFYRKPLDILELRDAIDGLIKAKQSSKELRRPYLTC